MADGVSTLLEQRRHAAFGGSFRKALIAALILHLFTPIAFWLIPRWLKPPRPPIQYVAVQIVPAAKLGVEKPKPKPVEPKPAPKPEPKPEPVKPSPKAAVPAPVKPKPAAKKPPPAPQPEEQGTPTGNAAGLSLGGATATLDNPDFTYGYYVDQMLSQISRNWTRPPVGSGVEALIHYRILRDGRIVDAEVARSSGIASFDLAALRAVQTSSPLPPLPRAFRDDSLGVNLIVR